MSSALAYAYPYVLCGAGCFCILLFLAEAIARWSRRIRWAAIAGLAILPGVLVFYLVQGQLPLQRWIMTLIYAAISTASVLSFGLAGMACRKQWRPVHFTVSLLGWTVVLVSFGVAAVLAFNIGRLGAPPLLPAIIVTLTLSVTVYVLTLPFVFVALRSPVYQQRLKNIMVYKQPAIPEPAAVQAASTSVT
jgi:hypothetical protein